MISKAKLFDAVGGLSKPSKMPGYGWSIPAKLCLTGSKLRSVTGSVCASCYALKGRYVFPNVETAMQRRLDIYNADPSVWVGNMVKAILASGSDHFRWFDSGDLQSVEMLANIALVASWTPYVKHWLPTREHKIVAEYVKLHYVPDNLCIRLSSPMVDQIDSVSSLTLTPGVTKSAVVTTGSTCTAKNNGNKCGDCRACWDRSVELVKYPKH